MARQPKWLQRAESDANEVRAMHEERRDLILDKVGARRGARNARSAVALLQASVDELLQATASLLALELAYAAEANEGVEQRRRLTEATATVRDLIASARQLAKTGWDRGFVQALGVRGQTPKSAPAVRQMARLLLQGLEGDLPESTRREALASLTEPLRAELTNLDQLIEQEAADLARHQTTEADRGAARKAFSACLEEAVELLKGVLIVAREREAARTLQLCKPDGKAVLALRRRKTSGRRRGAPVEAEEPGLAGDGETAAGDGGVDRTWPGAAQETMDGPGDVA